MSVLCQIVKVESMSVKSRSEMLQVMCVSIEQK